jgi:predicted AAA+ superfamily ATPase
MFYRKLTMNLLQALNDTPVVLLNGARQVGKSTLARQLISAKFPAHYLTFDDSAILNIAKSNPQGFINDLKLPVILDEIQHVPELFSAIKMAVDGNRKAGSFLLTGSANVLLLPKLSESLAGRMEILTLWPLAQSEITKKKGNFIDQLFSDDLLNNFISSLNTADLIEMIVCGGFPESIGRHIDGRRRVWFKSYIETILKKDVRDLANIEGLIELPRLLQLLAARCGGLLNFSELSRSFGIPQTTLKRYLALLETIFLLQRIPAWSNNLSKRLVKSPKIILNDTGFIAYLLGLNHERFLAEKQLFGHILENFVIVELQKEASWSNMQPQFSHFRTQAGQEVDLILENTAGKIVGIEIKSTATIDKKDLQGLLTLAEISKKHFHRGIIFYTGKHCIPCGNNIFAVPIDMLWA